MMYYIPIMMILSLYMGSKASCVSIFEGEYRFKYKVLHSHTEAQISRCEISREAEESRKADVTRCRTHCHRTVKSTHLLIYPCPSCNESRVHDARLWLIPLLPGAIFSHYISKLAIPFQSSRYARPYQTFHTADSRAPDHSRLSRKRVN